MPKVSVILTSFKHEKYIREAIDSVLNQSFTDYELVIWDDASSDNSWEIINSYQDVRIKTYRNKQNMAGGNINRALEIVSGEYIAIHHSDDVWEPEKLEKQVAFMDMHPEFGAVFTSVTAIGEDSKPLKNEKHFYFSIFEQPNRTRFEWLNFFFNRGNALCHPSVLIRKTCFNKCGHYRFSLAQTNDIDMWIRLCLQYEIHVLPEKLVRFRVRENEANVSGNRLEARIRGLYELYKLLPNYRKIGSFDDLVKVFPSAAKYYRNEETDIDFALAMVALEERPFTFTTLFGQDILFEIISDPKRADNIKRLYDFDYKSFIALTARHDVFSREEVATLSGQLVSLNQAVTERDRQIANLKQAVVERDRQLVSLNQAVAERERATQGLTEKDQLVVLLNKELEEQRAILQKIFNSRSWWVTKPIRVIGRLLRGDWEAVRASIHSRRDAKTRSFIKEEKNHEVRNPIVNSELNLQSNAPSAPIESTLLDHKRFLLVSYYCPTRAHAGGLRMLDIYSLIKAFYPKITIDLYTYKRPEIDWLYSDVEQIFDHIFYSSVEELSLGELTKIHRILSRYDVIDLQFHRSAYHMEEWRKIGGKILFTPMESLLRSFLINVYQIFRRGVKPSLRKTIVGSKSAIEEIIFASKADEVVCVSKKDASILRMLCPSGKINFLETGVSHLEFTSAFSHREDELKPELKKCIILYIAYFGSETNIMALKWYLENVHFLAKKAVSEYKLKVVGRGDLSIFNDYQSDSIELIGEVPILTPYIQEAKVGIAPALGGAGFRGKINQYSIYGVPSVVTSISAKGLIYENGVDIYIADEPKKFADRCIQLLMDNDLNKNMGNSARKIAFSKYTWESKMDTIKKIYALEDV